MKGFKGILAGLTGLATVHQLVIIFQTVITYKILIFHINKIRHQVNTDN